MQKEFIYRTSNSEKWCSPGSRILKGNVHANWRNARLHSGVAWIARDQSGNVSHHARDAQTYSPNRMVAELRCIIWTLRSLRDIQVPIAVIASDYREVIEAINAQLQWPLSSLIEPNQPAEKYVYECLFWRGEGISEWDSSGYCKERTERWRIPIISSVGRSSMAYKIVRETARSEFWFLFQNDVAVLYFSALPCVVRHCPPLPPPPFFFWGFPLWFNSIQKLKNEGKK